MSAPPRVTNYNIVAEGAETVLVLGYRRPGAPAGAPASLVTEVSMATGLLFTLVESVITGLDPVKDRSTLDRLMRALAAKLPDEQVPETPSSH